MLEAPRSGANLCRKIRNQVEVHRKIRNYRKSENKLLFSRSSKFEDDEVKSISDHSVPISLKRKLGRGHLGITNCIKAALKEPIAEPKMLPRMALQRSLWPTRRSRFAAAATTVTSQQRRTVWNASKEQEKEAEDIAQQIRKIEGMNKTPSTTRINEIRQLKEEYKKLTGEDYDGTDPKAGS